MIKARKRFAAFVGKIVGKGLSLQHSIFLRGAIAGMALSAFGVISNLIIGLPFIAVLVPLVNFIIDIACVVYSIVTKRWKGAAIVIYFFASFALFPFLWFTTGGTMSSNLPLIIGLGVVLAIVFQGKVRGVFFFSTLLLYSAFIVIELYYPNNFIPYPSRSVWYMDVLFGFVLSFLASGGVAYFTVNYYNAIKRETEMLMRKLEKSAIIDPLTGVFNRGHLMARIDEEMRKAFDTGESLAICMLDIDHFKNVNDSYGHVYGDEVLVKIASIIAGCLTPNEILGRYGGEEFVVLFPGRDALEAYEMATDFCKILRQTEWPRGKPITISGGISEYTKGLSYSRFLENADSNLYIAKNNGRDRVEV